MKHQLFLFLLISWAIFLGNNGYTQNFSPGACPGTLQPEYVKHLQANLALGSTITIGAPGGAGAPFTWGYAPGTGNCGSGFTSKLNNSTEDIPGSNLRLTFHIGPTAATTNVTVSSTGNLVTGEYPFTLRLNYGGSDRVKPFRFIVRNPLDMVFVLDRSGSMECDVDESISASWPGCISFDNAAGDHRRWDILKESCDNFINKLDPNHLLGGASGDQFSVVYFSGSILPGGITNDGAEFQPVTSFTLPLDGTGHTPFYQEMNGSPVWESTPPRLARDGTSLGEGMYKAINERFNNAENPNRRQVALLFTDGEQNVGKWFDPTGKNILPNSGGGAALINLNAASIDNIQVFTAGLINVTAAETLLQNIADNHTPANPSYFNVLPGQETEFESEIGVAAFNQIYNTYSPQTIGFFRNIFSYNSVILNHFPSNKGVNRLIFEAHFDAPLARKARMIIEKDGVDVSHQISVLHQGDFITTAIFNLYDLPDLSSEGTWTVKLINQDDAFQKNKVNVFATADDHHVEFDGNLKNGRIHVGQTLKPAITLSANGQAITDALAKAIILKPGEDLGHILATNAVTNLNAQSNEAGTCAGKKLDYFEKNNPALLNEWKNLQRKEITLTHVGNGQYEGTYNDVDVTGNYKVIYMISGNSAELGKIERLKNQTINVRFAPINVNLETRAIQRSKDGNRYFFSAELKPAYVNPDGQKRYLGPGYEHAFTLKGANFTRADDQCDGSYNLYFSSAERNPKVELSIYDDKIYSGRANALDETYVRYKKNFSVHGGYANPFGQLDTLYNSGGFLELDFGYSFNNYLSLEAVGGYYGFKENFSITGAALFLKYNWAGVFSPTTGLFVAAGPGVYKPKAEDLSLGYSLKAGFEKRFQEHWTASLEFAGVFPKADRYFGTAGIGLQYHF